MDKIIEKLTDKDDKMAYQLTKEIAAASELSSEYYSCILKLSKSKSFNGSLNDTDLIKFLGITKNTFYKYKKELME